MSQHRFACFLLAIASGHVLTGVVLFAPDLAQLPQRGWVNAIGDDFMAGSVAVWFLFFSWPLLLIVSQFWRSSLPLKRSFLVLAIAGSALGISLMPASGFWLMLILAVVALFQRRPSANHSLALTE